MPKLKQEPEQTSQGQMPFGIAILKNQQVITGG